MVVSVKAISAETLVVQDSAGNAIQVSFADVETVVAELRRVKSNAVINNHLAGHRTVSSVFLKGEAYGRQ